MRKLLAAFLVFLASCATVQPKAERVVDCTADKLQKQSVALFTEVLADLAAQDYMGLLADLATRVGQDVVICVVQEIRMRKMALPGTDAATMQAHATEYLRRQKS